MSETQLVEVADNENATEQNQQNLTSDDLLSYLSGESSEAEPTEPIAEAIEEVEETKEVLSQSNEDETSSEGESEEDDHESEEDSEDEPEQPKSVQKLLKQVSRLTARSKGAEEAVEQLTQQVESMKLDKKVEQNPTIEEAQDLKQLEVLREEALSAKKWARKHEDEDYVTEGEKEYTKQEIKQIRDSAEEHLEELIPARKAFLKARQESDQIAFDQFPQLMEKDSDDRKLLENMMRDPNLQGLNKIPNGLYLRALMIEGIKSVKARKDGTKKPVKKIAKTRPKPPPPAAPGSDASPPMRSSNSKTDQRKQMLGESNISEGQLSAFLST